MENIGIAIKGQRMRKGFDIKKFSSSINLSALYLHEIETGKREPSQEELSKILKALNMPELSPIAKTKN